LQRCKSVEVHKALDFNCSALNVLCIACAEAKLNFEILAPILLLEL